MNRIAIRGAIAALLFAVVAAHATDTRPATSPQPTMSLREAAEGVRMAIKREKDGHKMAALRELSRVLRALTAEQVRKLDEMAKVAGKEAVTDRVFRLRLSCPCPEKHEADCLLKCARCGGTGVYEQQTCPGCAGCGKVICHRCGGTNLLRSYPTPYEMLRLLAHYLEHARKHFSAAASSFDAVTTSGDGSLTEHSGIASGMQDLTRAASWLDRAIRFRTAIDNKQQAELDATVKQKTETEDKAAAALLTVAKAALDEFDKLLKLFKDDKTTRDKRLAALRKMIEHNGLANTFYRLVEVRYPRGFTPHKKTAEEVAGRKQSLKLALETVERRNALLADAIREYRRKDYADCVSILERIAKYLNAVEMKEVDTLCEKANKRKFAELMGRARFYALAAGQNCGKPTDLDAAAFIATGMRRWDRGLRKVREDLNELDRKADDRLRRIEIGVNPGSNWPSLRRKAASNIKRLRKMARFMKDCSNKAVRAADRQRIPRMADAARRLETRREEIERKFAVRPPDPPE